MGSKGNDETSIKYLWLDTVCSRDGPESPTMRLVLMVLGRRMDPDGTRCYPGTATVAAETGLGLRAVQTHLRRAESDGWIRRAPHGGGGQGWRRYRYEPTIPKRAARGTAPCAAPYQKRAASDDIRCGTSQRKVRHEVPTTSPETSPETSPVSDGSAPPIASRERYVLAVDRGHYKQLHRLAAVHLEGFDLKVAAEVCRMPECLLGWLEDRGREDLASVVGGPGDEAEVIADAVRDMCRKLERWDGQTFWAFVMAAAEVRSAEGAA